MAVDREEQRFRHRLADEAEAAQKAGKFEDEITPFTISTRKGDEIIVDDEFIRHGVTYEALAKSCVPATLQGRLSDGWQHSPASTTARRRWC